MAQLHLGLFAYRLVYCRRRIKGNDSLTRMRIGSVSYHYRTIATRSFGNNQVGAGKNFGNTCCKNENQTK
jgi:hypothetical protein